MAIIINIDDKEYKVKDINKLSSYDFDDLNYMVKATGTTVYNFNKKILNILTDIPLDIIDKIPIENILELNFIDIITTGIKDEELKEKYLNQNLLVFDNLSMGDYIDLDFYLTRLDVAEELRKYYIVARLLDGEDKIDEKINDVRDNMNIGEIMSIYTSFLLWRDNMIKSHPSIFSIKEEEEEDIELGPDDEEPQFEADESKIQQWGWLGIVYSLTSPGGGELDILKVKPIMNLNFLETITFLEYKKDLNDEIARIQKHNNKK